MMERRTLTRRQARDLDRRAMEEYGIEPIVLMENAGRACADEVERLLRAVGVARAMTDLRRPGSRDDIPRNVEELDAWKRGLSRGDHPVAVLCGPGNNGGDGLVIARTLRNRGHEVETFFVGDFGKLPSLSPAVQQNARLLRGLGAEIREIRDAGQLDAARGILGHAPVLVDALFGTGLSRTVDDPWRAVIMAMNESEGQVLAVDIPSGLDADTGDIHGVAVRAAVTVTFVAPKTGFFCKAGEACCGKVRVAEIGVPTSYLGQLPDLETPLV